MKNHLVRVIPNTPPTLQRTLCVPHIRTLPRPLLQGYVSIVGDTHPLPWCAFRRARLHTERGAVLPQPRTEFDAEVRPGHADGGAGVAVDERLGFGAVAFRTGGGGLDVSEQPRPRNGRETSHADSFPCCRSTALDRPAEVSSLWIFPYDRSPFIIVPGDGSRLHKGDETGDDRGRKGGRTHYLGRFRLKGVSRASAGYLVTTSPRLI